MTTSVGICDASLSAHIKIGTSVVIHQEDFMKQPISSTEDLGLVIRAVRKSTQVRQDDLAGAVGVSRRFTAEVERGKPTVQFGRVLRLLEELGITVTLDIPEDAVRVLATLKTKPPGVRTKKSAQSINAKTKQKAQV